MPYEEQTLSRDQLYEDVWTRPVIQIAKELGISDVALAKICRKLSVPLPPRGYWARIAAGRSPRKPELPRTEATAPTSHSLRLWRPPSGLVARPLSKEDRDLPAIAVAQTLENPHPLVRRTEAYLKRAAGRDFDPTALPPEAVLDVTVSNRCVDRALRIMDALLKALEAAGHPVGIRELRPAPQDPPRTDSVRYETYVLIQGQSVEFGLTERFDTIEIPPPPPSRPRESSSWLLPRPVRERIPNGRLMLYVRTPYGQRRQTWTDGKRQALEQCLASVLRALEDKAEANRLEETERQRRETEARERERRWLAEQERRRRQQELVEDLEKRLERWSAAIEIRRFADAVEAQRGTLAEAIDASALSRWLAWVRSWANELETDTLSALPDPGLAAE